MQQQQAATSYITHSGTPEELAKLAGKIAQVTAEADPVPKTGKHGQGWSFNTSAEVSKLGRLMGKHGLAFSMGHGKPEMDGGWLMAPITFRLTCGDTGAYIEAQWYGITALMGNPGKSEKRLPAMLTMYKKYFLVHIFLLETDGVPDLDDDRFDIPNGASSEDKPKRPKRKQAPPSGDKRPAATWANRETVGRIIAGFREFIGLHDYDANLIARLVNIKQPSYEAWNAAFESEADAKRALVANLPWPSQAAKGRLVIEVREAIGDPEYPATTIIESLGDEDQLSANFATREEAVAHAVKAFADWAGQDVTPAPPQPQAQAAPEVAAKEEAAPSNWTDYDEFTMNQMAIELGFGGGLDALEILGKEAWTEFLDRATAESALRNAAITGGNTIIVAKATFNGQFTILGVHGINARAYGRDIFRALGDDWKTACEAWEAGKEVELPAPLAVAWKQTEAGYLQVTAVQVHGEPPASKTEIPF
jgi:hypothetical protein